MLEEFSYDILLILIRYQQLRKALVSISITPVPSFIEVSEVQLEKALSPMFVTLLGIVMLVKLLQYANDSLNILVTLLPIVTRLSPLQ